MRHATLSAVLIAILLCLSIFRVDENPYAMRVFAQAPALAPHFPAQIPKKLTGTLIADSQEARKRARRRRINDG